MSCSNTSTTNQLIKRRNPIHTAKSTLGTQSSLTKERVAAWMLPCMIMEFSRSGVVHIFKQDPLPY